MSSDPFRHPPIPRPRHDGWTVRKQVDFIAMLCRTRNVSRAAEAVGMSRESAYRLRARPAGAEFAAAWDRAVRLPPIPANAKGHTKGHAKGHGRNGVGRRHFGLSPREGHESHGQRQTAPHSKLDKLKVAELEALIARACRAP